MIIDNVATQANSLLIHHPDAITDFILIWQVYLTFTDILDGIPAAGEGEDRALLAHPQDAVPPDPAA